MRVLLVLCLLAWPLGRLEANDAETSAQRVEAAHKLLASKEPGAVDYSALGLSDKQMASAILTVARRADSGLVLQRVLGHVGKSGSVDARTLRALKPILDADAWFSGTVASTRCIDRRGGIVRITVGQLKVARLPGGLKLESAAAPEGHVYVDVSIGTAVWGERLANAWQGRRFYLCADYDDGRWRCWSRRSYWLSTGREPVKLMSVLKPRSVAALRASLEQGSESTRWLAAVRFLLSARGVQRSTHEVWKVPLNLSQKSLSPLVPVIASWLRAHEPLLHLNMAQGRLTLR